MYLISLVSEEQNTIKENQNIPLFPWMYFLRSSWCYSSSVEPLVQISLSYCTWWWYQTLGSEERNCSSAVYSCSFGKSEYRDFYLLLAFFTL